MESLVNKFIGRVLEIRIYQGKIYKKWKIIKIKYAEAK